MSTPSDRAAKATRGPEPGPKAGGRKRPPPRDRVMELRRVRAGDLEPHPKNWRVHPQGQRRALRGVLRQVGHADALIARELGDGRLELIDGHLRRDLDPDQRLPVLVVDLSAEEAELV